MYYPETIPNLLQTQYFNPKITPIYSDPIFSSQLDLQLTPTQNLNLLPIIANLINFQLLLHNIFISKSNLIQTAIHYIQTLLFYSQLSQSQIKP